jgi:hypothetical protein
MDDLESTKNGFHTALIEAVIKQGENTVEKYLKMVNPSNNEQIETMLGTNTTEQRKNLALIEKFATDNKRETGNETQKYMLGQIKAIDFKLTPSPEKQVGMLQSLVNIMK